MYDIRRVGGIASLVAASTVVVGLVMFATLLTDYTTGDPTAAESVTFLADNEAAIFVWNLIILVVFSIALIPVALALYDRLANDAPSLASTATAFAVVWAGLLIASGMVLNVASGIIVDLATTDPGQSESLWLAVDTISNGMSGGMEIVGSVWVLLVSLAALRTGALPKGLGYLGLIMAIAGFATIIPALEMVGAIFGLGLIVWFTWLGIILLRQPSATPAQTVIPERA